MSCRMVARGARALVLLKTSRVGIVVGLGVSGPHGRYRVGGFDFSLDDLEHGVLRGSPAGDPRAFADGDPRQFLAVAKVGGVGVGVG